MRLPLWKTVRTIELIEIAIKNIHERKRGNADSPEQIQGQGEEVYQRHKHDWEQQYPGQYIAIHKDEVIAADTDKTKLSQKILMKQREIGPFRAYVMQLENPQMLAEEIADLTSYLDGLPPALRASGAFAAYENRLERLQQRLAHSQDTPQAREKTEGTGDDLVTNTRD